MLRRTIDNVKVVDGISLRIRAGETVGIDGRSPLKTPLPHESRERVRVQIQRFNRRRKPLKGSEWEW